MDPAELVNEAYLRIGNELVKPTNDRIEFAAMAARVMRTVLIDLARQMRAGKRGTNPGWVGVTGQTVDEDRVLEIDMALTSLASFDARASRIVELKFFGGLTDDEIAVTLGMSVRTVRRNWGLARAWLHDYLNAGATIQ